MTTSKTPPPIVIDTCVLASALITPHGLSATAVRRAVANYTPVFTEETLDELQTRLERPKLAKYTTPVQREMFLSTLRETGALFSQTVDVRACADPNDDMFFGLALASGAPTLLSGDNKVLARKHFHGVSIQSASVFLAGEASREAQVRNGSLRPSAIEALPAYPWVQPGPHRVR